MQDREQIADSISQMQNRIARQRLTIRILAALQCIVAAVAVWTLFRPTKTAFHRLTLVDGDRNTRATLEMGKDGPLFTMTDENGHDSMRISPSELAVVRNDRRILTLGLDALAKAPSLYMETANPEHQAVILQAGKGGTGLSVTGATSLLDIRVLPNSDSMIWMQNGRNVEVKLYAAQTAAGIMATSDSSSRVSTAAEIRSSSSFTGLTVAGPNSGLLFDSKLVDIKKLVP